MFYKCDICFVQRQKSYDFTFSVWQVTTDFQTNNFAHLDGRTINVRASCAEGLDFKSWASQILQTVRHRFNIFASGCVAWRYDAEIGTANSLHAST